MEKPTLFWVKSAYSFSWGTDLPEALVEEAARCGFSGVMLADTGGVYGQHRFAVAAATAGIKGIVGAEIQTTAGVLVVGALASEWGQLSRLVTSVNLEERVSHSKAFADSNQLFCIAKNPLQGIQVKQRGWEGAVYIPVLPGEPDPICSSGILPLACYPSMYVKQSSPVVHSILRKSDELLPESHVQTKPVFSCRKQLPVYTPELWNSAPFALENNLRLSELVCTLPVKSSYRPPMLSKDDCTQLRKILLPELKKAYGGSGAAGKRLADELDELNKAGLCGYFMVFHRIITYCRTHGIMAIARGSAAGSLVSRLLGLSAICPIRYGLSFSRFFNRLRDDPPDIDLDIDGTRRDEVYKWFLKEWGDRTAAVSAIVTYRTKSAVRVAAAACGVSRDETDVLAKLSRSLWNPIWKQPLPAEVMRKAELLKGLPSHLMPHPCGVVVGEGLIDSTTPVEMCAGGLPVTQLDMHGVEYTGLIKMDLLGQRGLTSLSLASGETDPVKLVNSSVLSSRTLELINSGRTIGVPHIESPAMRSLLKRMEIHSVEDVSRALALVRPGAASGGGRDRYMAGGERNIPAPLRNILMENRGVMLYQENVTEAACALLGLTPAEGDLMRRKLKRKLVKKKEVITACMKNGYPADVAERGWEMLSGYAGYGFCKAHSMTYAAVASAYAAIKAERPAAAMAAFLAAGGGFYRHPVYIEEARRLGLRILPPDVNSSEWFCTSPDNHSIMLGMGYLAGIGENEFGKIKKGRPYIHPVQVRASGIGLKLALNMAAAGCFDSMGMNRSQAAWCVKEGASSLFPFGMPPPQLPCFIPSARASKELELMEVTCEAHPLAFMKRPAGAVRIADMPESGQSLIWGRVVTGKSLKGGAGFLMVEDETGIADVFAPSPWYRKASVILRRPGATLLLRCERTVVLEVLE
jgi:DNA polymerase III alpha subunit